VLPVPPASPPRSDASLSRSLPARPLCSPLPAPFFLQHPTPSCSTRPARARAVPEASTITSVSPPPGPSELYAQSTYSSGQDHQRRPKQRRLSRSVISRPPPRSLPLSAPGWDLLGIWVARTLARPRSRGRPFPKQPERPSILALGVWSPRPLLLSVARARGAACRRGGANGAGAVGA